MVRAAISLIDLDIQGLEYRRRRHAQVTVVARQFAVMCVPLGTMSIDVLGC